MNEVDFTLLFCSGDIDAIHLLARSCQVQLFTVLSKPCFWVGFFFFFCVPQLYLWGSPLLGEIFAYVTVF